MPTFRIRVSAPYGPLMPSLADLRGEPPDGYERVRVFVGNGRPRGWFVDAYPEFSPTLLVLGTVYEVDAAGEWTAGLLAMARFVRELTAHGLPLPPNPVRAEIAE